MRVDYTEEELAYRSQLIADIQELLYDLTQDEILVPKLSVVK